MTEHDLELIEAVKVRRGSITLQEICDELVAVGDFNGNIPSRTVCGIIRNRMPSSKLYSRKKVTRLAKEGFTHANMVYTELFINDVNSKDPSGGLLRGGPVG